MDELGIVLGIVGIILGLVAMALAIRFHRKTTSQVKEFRKNVVTYQDAELRLGNDKRGTIVKRPDGSYAIDWKIILSDSISISEKAEAAVNEPHQPKNARGNP